MHYLTMGVDIYKQLILDEIHSDSENHTLVNSFSKATKC